MIAMQYTIRLADDYGDKSIRERAKRRHGLFNGLEGLVHKSYLLNPEDGLYAPFYVWQNDDAARAFLMGPLFQNLADEFGRPRVRSWTVLACGGAPFADKAGVAVKELDAIAPETQLADLEQSERANHESMLGTDGLCFHLTAVDPDRWELMRYSVWCDSRSIRDCDSDMVENYEILCLSEPEHASI